MDKALLVFLGAGFGGLGRFYLTEFTHAHFAARLGGLPVGTLVVNLIGSLLIGIAVAVAGEHHHVKHLVIIGLLGGFTTFSSFSRDAVELLLAGRHGLGLCYVALSVVGCIFGAWLGLVLGQAAVAR